MLMQKRTSAWQRRAGVLLRALTGGKVRGSQPKKPNDDIEVTDI